MIPTHRQRPLIPLRGLSLRRVLAVAVTVAALLGVHAFWGATAPFPPILETTAARAASQSDVTLGSKATSDLFVVLAQHQKVADDGLAMAERAWTLLVPHFPERPHGPVTIVIVESSTEYEAIQPAPMTRGFATFGGTKIFLRGDSVDQEVVTHELTHILFGLNVRPGLAIPDWFNEGLAQYTSGAPEATMQLIYDSSTKRLLTLQELDAVDALQSSDRDLATTEGLAVVRFLVNQYGDAQLWNLVDHLRTSKTFGQALLDTYRRTDLQLNDKWMAYASRHFSFFSPLLIETLITILIAVLAVAAAVIWLIRRVRRLAPAGGLDLTDAERHAAHLAELQLLHPGEHTPHEPNLQPPRGPGSDPPEIDTQDQAP